MHESMGLKHEPASVTTTPKYVQAEGVRPTVEVEGFFLLWGKVASGLGW